ncbi:threonine synthase-like 2 [Anneissia japonica]|uniref:threonine synthase-like 2 n=1 Tax=Anneissia japonica TaxID=1529436 RepID=UPI0014259133|nr:threonine synthase-like 2 [Anneissia japonica]
MTTVIKDNVHNFCVDGSSDDIDIVIKKVVLDLPFTNQHNLGTMNSINWGRVMVQTIHYFYAYFSQAKSIGDVVEIIVPTGGLGNCTAGCFASKMGLPIRLVCAVNTNDIVHRSFSTGDYSVAIMKRTLSPAMDIQVAYNIERIMWLVSDGDCDLVSKVLVDFESSNHVTRIPPDLLSKIQKVIGSGVTDDETTLKTMVRCWQENNYLLCPHTAVAVAYYYRKSEREREKPRSVCIATASPVKFPETVLKAGLTPHTTDEVSNLKNMPTKFTEMKLGEDWESMLRNCIISISEKNVSV